MFKLLETRPLHLNSNDNNISLVETSFSKNSQIERDILRSEFSDRELGGRHPNDERDAILIYDSIINIPAPKFGNQKAKLE